MNSFHDPHHVVLFPFMSKGHTIPIIGLARRLLQHRPNLSVTIFTTPSNLPFISNSLSDTTATIIDIPFPQHIPGIPPGVENTDKLPSVTNLYPTFCQATTFMQPFFEKALQRLPHVTFLVSDMILWWTLESANKFGFPRFVFSGMSAYVGVVYRHVLTDRTLFGPHVKSDDELVTLPNFPSVRVSRNDLDPNFIDPAPKGPLFELQMEQIIAASQSYGSILNSFYELESNFIDSLNNDNKIKAWCVGPLNSAENFSPNPNPSQPIWIQWLNQKLEQGITVLYVAFGTQAEISPEQLTEIAKGLESSQVNFLWVLKKEESELGDRLDSFEERGLVVRDWVSQKEILNHRSVEGFLSHCGWNSVMESICARVPTLAWPIMFDQPLNTRMVADEIKVGLRVETIKETAVKGFVKSEELEKSVKELMEGERGRAAREKVKVLAAAAAAAVEEDNGSSWISLEMLIEETSKLGLMICGKVCINNFLVICNKICSFTEKKKHVFSFWRETISPIMIKVKSVTGGDHIN